MHSRLPILPITTTTKLADVIHSDYRILLTINRFNIPLGFRDKTIQEVCEIHKVDTECLMAIMQLLINPEGFDTSSYLHLNPASVIGYLKNSHRYFLEKRLPGIRQHLSAILEGTDDVSQSSILNFFDNYYQEVQAHMGYENNIVFPYIESLLDGKSAGEFSIDEFESHHSNIHEKLVDLKNILIKYMQLPCDSYHVANVLFEIFQSEEDIDAHCFIEDRILVPIVRKIEKQG